MTAHDDAVKAAAEALAARCVSLPGCEWERHAGEAIVAVAAAAPFLLAAERQRIAEAILRDVDGRTGIAVQAWDEALRRAARIAESAP
jgi:dihydrodipicolinate synthase/N-acetylneuraminate lyase